MCCVSTPGRTTRFSFFQNGPPQTSYDSSASSTPSYLRDTTSLMVEVSCTKGGLKPDKGWVMPKTGRGTLQEPVRCVIGGVCSLLVPRLPLLSPTTISLASTLVSLKPTTRSLLRFLPAHNAYLLDHRLDLARPRRQLGRCTARACS